MSVAESKSVKRIIVVLNLETKFNIYNYGIRAVILVRKFIKAESMQQNRDKGSCYMQCSYEPVSFSHSWANISAQNYSLF